MRNVKTVFPNPNCVYRLNLGKKKNHFGTERYSERPLTMMPGPVPWKDHRALEVKVQKACLSHALCNHSRWLLWCLAQTQPLREHLIPLLRRQLSILVHYLHSQIRLSVDCWVVFVWIYAHGPSCQFQQVYQNERDNQEECIWRDKVYEKAFVVCDGYCMAANSHFFISWAVVVTC